MVTGKIEVLPMDQNLIKTISQMGDAALFIPTGKEAEEAIDKIMIH